MKSVLLPDYAADAMTSGKARSGLAPGSTVQDLRRVFLLIADALDGVAHPEWRLDQAPDLGSAVQDEPYGLDCFAGGVCVYAEERGKRAMLAIFETPSLAADYFVWIVSGGQRKIDWQRVLAAPS